MYLSRLSIVATVDEHQRTQLHRIVVRCEQCSPRLPTATALVEMRWSVPEWEQVTPIPRHLGQPSLMNDSLHIQMNGTVRWWFVPVTRTGGRDRSARSSNFTGMERG